MVALAYILALLSIHFHTSYGALFTDPSRVNGKTYDYVVVGAGVGGSVTASRLAESPNTRVLLIEAGLSNEGITNIIVPFFAFSASPNTAINWNYTTTPQASLFNRTILLPQGRVLGGGSSVNIMVYTRGPADDYERMSKITGDPSWSFKNIFPYIKKHEKWTLPQDGHDTQGQFNPLVHGYNGKVKISLPNYPTAIDNRVINALGTVPGFDYVEDMNSGNPLGVGWAQSAIGGGVRSSAATAYLSGQSKLDILIQTTATRIIQSGKKHGVPYFNSVEIAANASSPRFRVTARKEVILSAGAIGTPKLLMLSGIGPRSALTKLGVETVVHNGDVGQNLQEHPILAHQFEVSGNDSNANIINNIPTLLPEWEATKKGPLSNAPANHLGWARLEKNDTYLQSHPDPGFGPHTPHIEYIFANGFASLVGQVPSKIHYMSIFTAVSAPTSRGSVVLRSDDPFEDPIIDPAYLSTDLDLHVMVEATKNVRRFLSAPAWKDYIIRPHETAINIDLSDDNQIADYARNYTSSQWHPSCTAAMSSYDSPKGVVDPKLCVKGVAGLRIVDISVLPHVPAAHPQAVLYTIGEKAADMIKQGSC